MEAAAARRTAWVTIVGILFIIGGGFNLIWGLAAVGVSLGGTDQTVLGDVSVTNLEGIGIVGMVVGALQIFTGAGILARSPLARDIGFILAVLAILLNFGYYRYLDGWAWSGLVVNIGIVLILALRSEEFRY